MQDPAGILVAEVVEAAALPVSEREERRRGELGRERQRLQACEDAVSAEHRHEPGKPGSGKALAAHHRRREAECGEVDETTPVRRLQRLPVALHPWRIVEPSLEASSHVGPCLPSRWYFGFV